MKKFIVLIAAFVVSAGVYAQDSTSGNMSNGTTNSPGMDNMHQMKDCVMMKDGKMMVMKGGNTMAMTKTMTMKNGTMVTTNGTVKMKDGKTKMLKDGDCVNMDGMMSKMDMDDDMNMDMKKDSTQQ